MISRWAFLEGTGSKLIFHWWFQFFIWSKSLFNSLVHAFLSQTNEKGEVSSAKSLGFHDNQLINHWCKPETIEDQELNYGNYGIN